LKNKQALLIAGAVLVLVGLSALFWPRLSSTATGRFDGSRAYRDVQYQERLGPRIHGTQPHAQTIAWITAELTQSGWEVQVAEQVYNGLTAKNIIARRGRGPITLLGAHYDTRRYADQDPDPAKRALPVPGANDGASGVAVLLELGRSLPVNLDKQVWLVFFDLEDQGGIQGRDYIEGSLAFAASMQARPAAVVIVDMIGDASQNIYYEQSSDRKLSEEIWSTAASLGYSNSFIQQYRFNMIDDHTPFLAAGIPAVDIIDFDYPFWHTTSDTSSQVSAHSLSTVGDTLWTWLQK